MQKKKKYFLQNTLTGEVSCDIVILVKAIYQDKG